MKIKQMKNNFEYFEYFEYKPIKIIINVKIIIFNFNFPKKEFVLNIFIQGSIASIASILSNAWPSL
jgi:hypothetical protein